MRIKLKATLWKQKVDKDGRCPIAISVRSKGEESYYATNIKVSPDNWVGGVITRNEENYDILNAQIDDLLKTTRREILTRELSGDRPTVDEVKKMLRPDAVKGANFLKYAETVIEKKNASTKKRYGIELSKIRDYTKGTLSFGQITPKWLTAYHSHLLTKNNPNTAINAFKVIRHVFNEAKENKVTTLYPFDDWKYPQYKAPAREYLTIEECDKLYDLLFTDEVSEDEKLVIAFALVEAYSGIRVSDWGKFRVEQTRKHYDMVFTTTKTKTPVRLPLDLLPSLDKLLKYIADNGLVWNRTPEFANDTLKDIAKIVKIKKRFTTHLFRHTFATNSLSIGMTKEDISIAMGITVKQVDTYAKIDPQKLRKSLTRIGGGL